MTIKQIFCDMDGTLLNSKGEISKGNTASIKNLQIPFTLVSARAPMEMAFAIQQLELKSPQISFNGGLIFQREKVLLEAPLDNTIAKALLKHLADNFPQISLSYYTKEDWYAAAIDKGIQLESQMTNLTPKITGIENFIVHFQPIFKIMMIIFDENLLENVKNNLESLHFPAISIQLTGKNYLEITSSQAQKSLAIEFLLREKQIESSDIAAFGDGMNDLAMFALSDYSIALENAVPELKKIARFISKSNDEDGVAYGIKHFLTN